MSDEEIHNFNNTPIKVYFNINQDHINSNNIFMDIIEENGFRMNLMGELASEINLKTCILLELHSLYKNRSFISVVREVTKEIIDDVKPSYVNILRLFNYVNNSFKNVTKKHEYIIKVIRKYNGDLCNFHVPIFPPGFILKFYDNKFENHYNIYTVLLYNCYRLLYDIYYNSGRYYDYINNIGYCIRKTELRNELSPIFEQLDQEHNSFIEKNSINYNLTFHLVCSILSRLYESTSMIKIDISESEKQNIDNFMKLYDNFMFKNNEEFDIEQVINIIKLYIPNPSVKFVVNNPDNTVTTPLNKFLVKKQDIPENNLIYMMLILKFVEWSRLLSDCNVLLSGGITDDFLDGFEVHISRKHYQNTSKFDHINMISPVYNLLFCVETLYAEYTDIVNDAVYYDKYSLLSEKYQIILVNKVNDHVAFERVTFKDLLYDLDYSVDYTKICELLQSGRNSELYPNFDIKNVLPVRYIRSENIENKYIKEEQLAEEEEDPDETFEAEHIEKDKDAAPKETHKDEEHAETTEKPADGTVEIKPAADDDSSSSDSYYYDEEEEEDKTD